MDLASWQVSGSWEQSSEWDVTSVVLGDLFLVVGMRPAVNVTTPAKLKVG